MASIHLQGILLDTLGEIDVGAVMTWTHLTATGQVIPTTKVDLIIPPNGFYSIDVEFGQIRIDYRTRNTERFIATVIVNGSSTATTIPELLNAAVPVTDPVIIQMQDILADTEAAKDLAEAAALQITTQELIGSTAIYAPDQVVTTAGFLNEGDGGTGRWIQNGVTAQPANKTPSNLGAALLNDGNGNQWELVLGNNNLAELGYDPVTFSIPSTFADLGVAMDFFSHFKSTDKREVTLNVETGHALTAGFRVQDGDYSFITLTSTDATVPLDAGFVTVSNTDLDAGVPRTSSIAFLGVNAKMPVLNMLVDTAGFDLVTGLELDWGSDIQVLTGKGVINTHDGGVDGVGGVNCRVTTGSNLHGFQSVFSGGNAANITVRTTSTASLNEAVLTGSNETGLDISRGATAYFKDADLSNNTNQGVYIRRAFGFGQGADLSDNVRGIWSRLGSKTALTGAIFDGCTTDVKLEDGSIVDVSTATKGGSPLDIADSTVRRFNITYGIGTLTNSDFTEGAMEVLTAESVLTPVSGDLIAIASMAYATIMDEAGEVRTSAGTIYGPDAGVRITIDGNVVINDTGRARGKTSGGVDNFSVISVPACSAKTSLKIEIYNRGGVSNDFGHKIYESA